MIPLMDVRGLRLKFDAATGGIERSARRLAAKIDWSGWRPGRPTVLCLDRALFRADVEELKKRTDYNWVKVRATAVKKHQEPWVAEPLRLQTYFTNWLETRCAHLKPGIEAFGAAFLEAASRVHPVDAVMSGNMDYWQDDAIKLGCKKLGIPFLVLSRENYTKKVDADIMFARFGDAKFKYGGTGVAVFAPETKHVMDDSGCFAPNSVFVTGAPRFDNWLEIGDVPESERVYMTLLSYADPVYMAQQNFAETLRLFAEAAKSARDPALKWRIKVKKPSEVEHVVAAMPEIQSYPLEIVWDFPLTQLYPRSRIIIGYNTLAAAEGLLTETPVVIPCWGDARRNAEETLIKFDDPEDAKVAYFPESAEEMKALIRRGESGELPARGTAAERIARFSRHIAIPEGGSCRAVGAYIAHFLEHAEAARRGR
jgi:hypothetical protein